MKNNSRLSCLLTAGLGTTKIAQLSQPPSDNVFFIATTWRRNAMNIDMIEIMKSSHPMYEQTQKSDFVNITNWHTRYTYWLSGDSWPAHRVCDRCRSLALRSHCGTDAVESAQLWSAISYTAETRSDRQHAPRNIHTSHVDAADAADVESHPWLRSLTEPLITTTSCIKCCTIIIIMW